MGERERKSFGQRVEIVSPSFITAGIADFLSPEGRGGAAVEPSP